MGIEVPALEASGVVATATLVDERGRPFRGLSHFGDVTSRWQVIAGRAEIAALPPGSWTVRVEARDGRSWESRAATTAGDRVSVVLE